MKMSFAEGFGVLFCKNRHTRHINPIVRVTYPVVVRHKEGNRELRRAEGSIAGGDVGTHWTCHWNLCATLILATDVIEQSLRTPIS